ncbi:MAG: regulatory protein RecX [Labilithrix sp.]
MTRSSTRPKAPPPALTQAVLHEAALAYLTHRSASVAQMRKVLDRRVAAWARRASEEEAAAGVEKARTAAEAVVERLLASGLLDDAAYAQRRAEALTRSGKSRRAVAFELARKGVNEEAARAAVPQDAETELAAAVALMRRKRIGPYARASLVRDDKLERRWLGTFARGGFSFSTAQRVLRMDRDAADEVLRLLR